MGVTSPNTGHGAVMGAHTGQVLDYGVLSKICRTRTSNNNNNNNNNNTKTSYQQEVRYRFDDPYDVFEIHI